MNASIQKKIGQSLLAKLKADPIRYFNGIVRSSSPHNAVNGHFYSGSNWAYLLMAGFTCPKWMTFNQAKNLGMRVDGEKGTTILVCKSYTASSKNAAGESVNEKKTYLSTATLFNLQQIKGAEKMLQEYIDNNTRSITAPEEIVKSFKSCPSIREGNYQTGAYCPETDSIEMPYRYQFSSMDYYYRVLFHELVHATGAANRQNRISLIDYGPNRPLEELVAELGSALLCGEAGIINPDLFNTHISYLQAWFRAMENNEEKFFEAVSLASKAVQMILGREIEDPNGSFLAEEDKVTQQPIYQVAA